MRYLDVMDLSYAQNLEDHTLACAFAGKRDGFYVDVGAGHPVADNVTCWFYLQGWRGLVVEPQDDLAALYAHVRPRDIVWRGLAGRSTSFADFHLVERLHGFSTMDARAADAAKDFGVDYRTLRMPVTTLDELCARWDVTQIDVLKIDVEGAEGEVLAGLDLARLRPAVICAEAVAPGSMAPNWAGWEPALLAAGYECALFDGLNRFYVAQERADLRARFPREKAPWEALAHAGESVRAPFDAAHVDHAFARRLVEAFLARLPGLDRGLLLDLVLHGESAEALAGAATADAKARALTRLFPDAARFGEASAGLMALEARSLRDYYERIVDSDPFRVMTGRLSMSYDGGQILD